MSQEVPECVLEGRSQQALNQAKAKLDLDSSQIQPKSYEQAKSGKPKPAKASQPGELVRMRWLARSHGGGTARPLAARAIDNSKGTPRSVPGTPREFPRILLGV